MLKKCYSAEHFVREYDLLLSGARILNAGSSSTRFGANCLNLDIQDKPDVDVVADLHNLPGTIGQFEAVICNAVLQYCESPSVVIAELQRVLVPGGLLFLEAPWVQPYCDDTTDRYRFSEQGLCGLLEDFELLASGPSITPGSALVMQSSHIVANLSSNKFARVGLSALVETLLFPLHWIHTRRPSRTAGAVFAVARKSPADPLSSPGGMAQDSSLVGGASDGLYETVDGDSSSGVTGGRRMHGNHGAC